MGAILTSVASASEQLSPLTAVGVVAGGAVLLVIAYRLGRILGKFLLALLGLAGLGLAVWLLVTL